MSVRDRVPELVQGGASAAPAVGSGIASSFAKLTADMAAQTAGTAVNVTGVSFAVTAGVYYSFKFGLVFRTGATATWVYPTVTTPAATFEVQLARTWGPADANAVPIDTPFAAGAMQAINTDYLSILEGVLLPSANGILQLQSQLTGTTGAPGATVRQGTFGILAALT